MGLFFNKKEEPKKEAVLTDFSFKSRESIPLFESTRGLLYEAESHYRNEEFQLCDDILAVVVKHIKRNKTAIIKAVEDPLIKVELGDCVPKASTRETNNNPNKE